MIKFDYVVALSFQIKQKEPEGDSDSGAVTHQETLDALSEMYR